MADYAIWECRDCGIQLPKNQLTRISEERMVGRKTGRFASGASNERVEYRTDDLLLCNKCKELRAARIAAARARARARLFGVILLICAGIAAILLFGRSSSDSPSKGLAVSKAPDSSPPNPPVNLASESAATTAPETPVQPEPSLSQSPEGQAPQSPLSSVTPEGEPALRIAVGNTLNSGHPDMWRSEDGQTSGSVSVSEPTMVGAQSCRTIRYTVRRAGEDWTSPDFTACTAGGGVWHPQEVSRQPTGVRPPEWPAPGRHQIEAGQRFGATVPHRAETQPPHQ